jgi:cell division septation protein DedD
MASHIDEPRRRRGIALFSVLILALGVTVPVDAQDDLDVVDALALSGQAEEARAVLESWWGSERARSSRSDRQRGLWLRAILTVDPVVAGLDFQRLVLEYPGGSHSDEAMLRLGLISATSGDLPRAARYFRTLMTDYPGSPQRGQAEEWLDEHSAAVAEAEAAAREARAAREAEATLEATVETTVEATVRDDAAAAEADVEEPEVSADRAETVFRFAVQVGAFESEERARVLMGAVTASGFRARMVRVAGSELVRVRIGAYADQARAFELMDRVRNRGHEATLAADVGEEEPIR